MRTDWTDLPEELRAEITAQTGPIGRIVPAPTGNHADIASTLETGDGRVFVKAARKLADRDGPEVMSLRREAAVNPAVREFAPRLRWQAEAGGWLALGFEHVQGRPADLSTGSPDLEILAKTVHTLQSAPCPDVPMLSGGKRWQRFADDPAPFEGSALLHTDLNEDNFLITAQGRAYVIDWAFVTRGAAWLELMLLIPWLIKAGHTPQAADQWVSQFPSWVAAPPADLDAFSAAFAQQWRAASQVRDDEWIARHADLTSRWAAYRLKE
ncbi:phosphotransferase [Actinomadura rubrisoli]|uniref:Aminoglycoside phosphotransferase n=1 Tax=Actinomadura rubrisoli TaxID=2530368 RepID=A0A4R5C9B8_9ACTN|nr:phosphotransferase [Actinomadura rubrisoli]TDD94790.1 aminoglycoside phosphotransferase [Actinomadura rubrisoli]